MRWLWKELQIAVKCVLLGFVVACLTVTVVFAADPATQIRVVDWVKWLTPENLYYLAQIVAVLVTLASPFMLKALVSIINLAEKKSKNTLLHMILERIRMEAPGVAKAVYEEYVKNLKSAGKDRRLTLAEIATANSLAIDKVRTLLGADALRVLDAQGIKLDGVVPGIIGVAVEEAKQAFQALSANGGGR